MHKSKISQIKFWCQKNSASCDSALNSLLATFFESLEEFDEALSQMNLAMAKSPQNGNLCEKMVWMACQAGRLGEVEQSLQSSSEKRPKDYRISRALGVASLLKGESSLAVRSLQKSLESKKDEEVTHFLLGYSLLGLAEKNMRNSDSGSDLLDSIRDEFQRAGEMPFFKEDSDFQEGKEFVNKGDFPRSLDKMELVLGKIRELQVEPASFSNLALSFLADQEGIDQDELNCTIAELKKRCEQGKEYPQINNHLGLCFLILWKSLFFQTQSQLGLAVKKDAKFQKARSNLEIVRSSDRRISALVRELRF